MSKYVITTCVWKTEHNNNRAARKTFTPVNLIFFLFFSFLSVLPDRLICSFKCPGHLIVKTNRNRPRVHNTSQQYMMNRRSLQRRRRRRRSFNSWPLNVICNGSLKWVKCIAQADAPEVRQVRSVSDPCCCSFPTLLYHFAIISFNRSKMHHSRKRLFLSSYFFFFLFRPQDSTYARPRKKEEEEEALHLESFFSESTPFIPLSCLCGFSFFLRNNRSYCMF